MGILENPKCICDFKIENAQHYFFSCPLYSVERIELHDAIGQITEITLDTILSGNESLSYEENVVIFSAVHEFIERSGRFPL